MRPGTSVLRVRQSNREPTHKPLPRIDKQLPVDNANAGVDPLLIVQQFGIRISVRAQRGYHGTLIETALPTMQVAVGEQIVPAISIIRPANPAILLPAPVLA